MKGALCWAICTSCAEHTLLPPDVPSHSGFDNSRCWRLGNVIPSRTPANSLAAACNDRGGGRAGGVAAAAVRAVAGGEEGEAGVKLPYNAKIAQRLFTADAELATEEPMCAQAPLFLLRGQLCKDLMQSL